MHSQIDIKYIRRNGYMTQSIWCVRLCVKTKRKQLNYLSQSCQRLINIKQHIYIFYLQHEIARCKTIFKVNLKFTGQTMRLIMNAMWIANMPCTSMQDDTSNVVRTWCYIEQNTWLNKDKRQNKHVKKGLHHRSPGGHSCIHFSYLICPDKDMLFDF